MIAPNACTGRTIPANALDFDARGPRRKAQDEATKMPMTWMAAEKGISMEDYISWLYEQFPTAILPEWNPDFMGYCSI